MKNKLKPRITEHLVKLYFGIVFTGKDISSFF